MKLFIKWGMSLIILTSCTDDHTKSCRDQIDGSWQELFYQTDYEVKLKSKPEYFGSCEELAEAAKSAYSINNFSHTAQSCVNQETSVVDQTMPLGQARNMPTNQPTNVQVSGVDEGDRVKVSDHYIFYAKNGYIEVIKRHSLKPIKTLALPGVRKPQLFIYSQFVVLLGETTSTNMSSASSPTTYTPPSKKTLIKIYEISDDAITEPIYENTIPGKVINSRLNGSDLYVITAEDHLSWLETDLTAIPSHLAEQDCSNALKPITSGTSPSMTHLFKVALKPNFPLQSLSFMGEYDDIFMSKDNLYLTTPTSFNSLENKDGEALYSQSVINLLQTQSENYYVYGRSILKFDLDDSQLQIESHGFVPGKTIGSWSYQEVKDHLVVATTTSNNVLLSNHLFVLGSDEKTGILDTVASVQDFGVTEDIRSVRFIDSLAYIVTYQKTDPLFIIDLANIRKPKLLSELKAPGFSVYMHPLGKQRMLGLGFAGHEMGDFSFFQGLQLSLFDISDSYAPKTLSQLEVGDRGSYSDAVFDHHAFYYSSKSSLVGFPFVEKVSSSDSPSEFGRYKSSGAALYRFNNDQYEYIGDVSHSDWVFRQCPGIQDPFHWWSSPVESNDINRVLELDGKLLTFSRFGMKAHNISGNKLQQHLAEAFSVAPDDCSISQNYWW